MCGSLIYLLFFLKLQTRWGQILSFIFSKKIASSRSKMLKVFWLRGGLERAFSARLAHFERSPSCRDVRSNALLVLRASRSL